MAELIVKKNRGIFVFQTDDIVYMEKNKRKSASGNGGMRCRGNDGKIFFPSRMAQRKIRQDRRVRRGGNRWLQSLHDECRSLGDQDRPEKAGGHFFKAICHLRDKCRGTHSGIVRARLSTIHRGLCGKQSVAQ